MSEAKSIAVVTDRVNTAIVSAAIRASVPERYLSTEPSETVLVLRSDSIANLQARLIEFAEAMGAVVPLVRAIMESTASHRSHLWRQQARRARARQGR